MRSGELIIVNCSAPIYSVLTAFAQRCRRLLRITNCELEMTQLDFESNTFSESSSNYPTETDSSFTEDEKEAISAYKENVQKKIAKNRSILKGLETSFWGITSYSLARFLILTSGTQGIGLAIAASFLINNITNRDCLDGFNLDRKDGQFEVSGMGKIIKFAFSTLVASFVVWSAIGDFVNVVNNSKNTYDSLQTTVKEFNKLPENKQNMILIIGGVFILCGLYVIVDSKRYRK
jgi:hypothetical protein